MAVKKVKRKPRAKAATPAKYRRRRTTAAVAPRRRTRRRTKGMAEGLSENFSLSNSDSGLRQVATGVVVAYVVNKFVMNSDQTREQKIGLLAAGSLAAIAFKQNGAAVALGAMLAIEYMKPATVGTAEGIYFDPAVLNDGDEPLILDADGNVVMMSDGSYYQPSYMPQY